MNRQSLIDDLFNDIMEIQHKECVLSQGTVYGVQYHCVEPRGISWREMERWALDRFGKPGSIWDIRRPDDIAPEPNSRYYMNDSKFWFKDQNDLLIFLMRWR